MFWNRRRREDDLRREIESHLELEAEEQQSAGVASQHAGYAARRALGNTTRIAEQTRETWGGMWLDRLAQDLGFAFRVLRASPGFSAVVILTAALGIGANTSIFSVVDAVLLRPLPYRDPHRLITPRYLAKDTPLDMGIGDFQYTAWREQAPSLESAAAYTGRTFTLTGNGEAELLQTRIVTPGFLRVLGVAPTIGRDFSPDDAAQRGGKIAILTYSFWMRRFSGDPAILSRQFTLEGKPYTIAGVLPRGFEFPGGPNVSLLLAMNDPAGSPADSGVIYFYDVIVRMKPGVTAERVESDLALINQRLEAAYPKKFGRSRRSGARTQAVLLYDRLVGNVRPALLVLSGAVALVLLIVCVNISNLLLARAVARQKEIAVRIALGAGRARVFRQLLTEGMLLAFAGGGAGLLLAFGGVRLLRAIAPIGVAHVADAHISLVVLAFNFAIAAAAGLLFGIAPIRGVGADPEAVLKQTARATTGHRRQRRLESALVVAEIAFALILLAGAGLLIRTFAGLTAIPPGFRPESVVTARIPLPYWKYPTPDRQRAFIDQLMEKVAGAPGVETAGLVACLPYSGFVMTGAAEVEGRPHTDPNATFNENLAVNFASGDYFRTMGIPVLEGRAIDSSDRAGGPSVAVINATAARRFFPGEHAVGKRIRGAGVTEWVEIVGVVGDIKQGSLASEARAEIVLPAAQSPSGSSARTLAIRSHADARVIFPWLRARVAEMDSDIPPLEVETMRDRMSALMNSQVFVMRLLALFAAIAIALAAIGIYSVLVYSVERRSREIGIRLALGAGRAHIAGLVVGRGLRLSAAGAVLGIGGGLLLTRYLETLLYGVTPHDPATLAAGAAVLIVVAALAAWLPARRAVGQDAVQTLRAE